ncbi:MAG: hypothetical protein NWE78_08120 [Candidatus Bathyarchaeota archaeon]|nr:hypothetical protein [Candidatus Bathyarchaeota archaeon]
MTKTGYQLGSEILRTTQNATLWKNKKGIVEIAEDVPAVQIRFDEEPCGYIFRGKGRLRVDTIAETEQGAVGKPVDKEINEPFLMLGETKEIQENLKLTDDEDLARLEIGTSQDFLTEAEDLLDKFLQRSSHRNRHRFNNELEGFIFAFQNAKGKLDLLIGKGTKLVYTAVDKVFVSKRNKVVLTSDGEVAISRPGKSVIVSKGCCPSIHIHNIEHETSE